MIYFEGKGAPLRLVRKTFGQELVREIPTDLATGIRVLEVGEIQLTKSSQSSEAVVLRKSIEILKANAGTEEAIAELEAQATEFEATVKPSRFRNVFFRGNGQLRRQNLTVFESDGKLNLFDNLKPGDLINVNVTKLPGGNGFRCLNVELADPVSATQAA